ncbi:hypothetical protein FB451DRAFT_1171403 [Mycena latifolia]|nr:hypothetical protein FB451DRAFT_1171403 [Mycena latifolia]
MTMPKPPQTAHNPEPPPVTKKRSRTMIACSNCRRRKKKCLRPEGSFGKPCQRCITSRLPCDYFSALHPEAGSLGTDSTQGVGVVLSPPYTGPPPLTRRPRYSGLPLPELTQSLPPLVYTTPLISGSIKREFDSGYLHPSLGASVEPSIWLPDPRPWQPLWTLPIFDHSSATTQGYDFNAQIHYPLHDARPSRSPPAKTRTQYLMGDSHILNSGPKQT